MARPARVIFCSLALAGSWLAPVHAQYAGVTMKRQPLPVATVKDPGTIKFFVEQFFIPEAKVDSIDFIDVDGLGFNEKDVIKVYPSKEVYNLTPSDTAMSVIRQWKGTSVRVVGSKDENDQILVQSKYAAADAMYAGLVRLIEKNYVGKKISLMFDYDGTNQISELLVWGYKEQELLTPKNPLEQFAHDLMIYVRTDTMWIEKPVYDIIYIEHTISDSLSANHGGQ